MRIPVVLFALTLFVAGLGAMVSIAVPIGPAAAHEWPVKQIGHDYDNASCIGDVSTRVCVVESWIACFVRWDPELCEQVGLPLTKSPQGVLGTMYEEYQVVAVWPVDVKLVAERLKEDLVDWLGVYEVRVLRRRCEEGSECGGSSFTRYAYYLKREKESWRVFRWAFDDPDNRTCIEEGGSLFDKTVCSLQIGKWVMPWVHLEDKFD